MHSSRTHRSVEKRHQDILRILDGHLRKLGENACPALDVDHEFLEESWVQPA
jgi:hypothetical protein